MALGFIKKMFSFGKKEVEEVPTDVPAASAAATNGLPLPMEAPADAPSSPDAAADLPVPALLRPEASASEAPVARSSTEETEPAAPLSGPAIDELGVPAAPEPLEARADVQLSEEHAMQLRDIAEVAPAAEAAAQSPLPSPLPDVQADGAGPAGGAKVTVSRAVERKAEPRPSVAPERAPRVSWYQRLREGLSRSSRELTTNISGIFTKRKLDDDTLQDLEDVLIRADLGVETALRVTDALAASRYGKDISDEEVRAVMAQEVEKVLAPVALPLELDLSHKPHVILVVGVNGTGKTTTIGKLAAKLTSGGLSVTLAAGDTFRAAAIEQLKIWGERTGSPVVSSKLGADAAGLAWDAYEKAKAAGSDVLIIDTAGRLQNKAELMAELEKIVRVLGKHDPEAPHTVLQTVDATTGQNALNQVEIFRNVAGVNGLVMTKLDGTARGGILVAIAAKHRLPVYFIGVGEQVDDLEPFSAGDFAKAIAGVR